MRQKKGFTLIELLVVIAIIALLLAVLMPSLAKVKEAGRRIVCGSHMHELGLSIRLYCEQEDDFLPAMRVASNGVVNNTQATNHHARWWRTLGSSGGHSYWNLGLLWKAGILEGNGKIFFCPGSKAKFKYKDYAVDGGDYVKGKAILETELYITDMVGGTYGDVSVADEMGVGADGKLYLIAGLTDSDFTTFKTTFIVTEKVTLFTGDAIIVKGKIK